VSEELLALADKVVGWAREGEQVEAYAVRNTELEVKVSGGDVEQLSSATSEGVGIRVVVDGRVGMAWAGSLDADIVADALADARDNAGFATADEHAGLAGPDGVRATPVDLWRDDVAATPTPDKVAFAVDIERRILADKRIRSLRNVVYGDERGEEAIATTTGIRSSSRSSAAYSYGLAVAGEGDASTTGSGMTFGRGWSDLRADKVVDDAILKSTRMLGAAKPASATVTIVLDPSAAATILALVAGLCDGEDVLKGRTLFANRMGEQVASPLLTLVEDPTNPEAFNASEYDAEGLASRPTMLIQDGTLAAFLYDTRWARAAGAQSTASAVRSFKSSPHIGARAVAPKPGTLSHEEVLAAVGTGLYVQSMAGLHSGVDPVSGDFSVGCEGLMIRDGVLAEPVKECVIASTLPKMLLGISHVGGDLEWGPGSAARITLAIDDVSLAGS
jgi:PmbA protein